MSDQHTFKIQKNPFGCGSMYKKEEITFNRGLTVLVGCNGSGKTTLISNIYNDNVRKIKNRVIRFDNLTDGGTSQYGFLISMGRINELASLYNSSEGEKIPQNLSRSIRKINDAVQHCTEEDRNVYILYDAVDSGSSIDNIMDTKDFIKFCIDDMKTRNNIDMYFIVSANSFEMANGENCFDTVNGEYISFKDYEDYKKFILKSRKAKESRDKRFNRNIERQRLKEEKQKPKDPWHIHIHRDRGTK